MNNKEVLKMDDVTLLQQDENGTNNYRFCNHNLRCTKAFANEMQKKRVKHSKGNTHCLKAN